MIGSDDRLNTRWREETGSVTAELAVALPTVVLMFGVLGSVGAAQLARIDLAQQAASAARAIAIGDKLPAGRLAKLERVLDASGLTCVRAERVQTILGLGGIVVAELSCSRELGK